MSDKGFHKVKLVSTKDSPIGRDNEFWIDDKQIKRYTAVKIDLDACEVNKVTIELYAVVDAEVDGEVTLKTVELRKTEKTDVG